MSEYFGKSTGARLSLLLRTDLSYQKLKVRDYLYECLGDVFISAACLDTLCDSLTTYRSTDKYDVSFDPETIRGIYKIYVKYPQLSRKALSIISSRYIKDLFDDYSLELVLECYIEKYGMTDEAFEMFIAYVDEKALELQKKYEEDAKKLDEYADEYFLKGFSPQYQYISYLKRLVLRQHISATSLIHSMPSPELIEKDAKHLQALAYKHSCFMGLGYPVSYLMTREYAKHHDLSKFGLRPSYYVSSRDVYEPATFTTQEFIGSVCSTKRFIK